MLNPRGVAVVGASQELHRIGGQPVRNLSDFGYPGEIYPVNPKYREIKNLTCYPDITEVPPDCDLAVIAVGAKFVPSIIRKCGQKGISYAVILSSGFGEAGDEGANLQRDLINAISESGVRVIGPNCVGLLNLKTRMFCGMGTGFQDPGMKSGPVAMVTQSGGVGFSVVSLAERSGVGFNYVISSGNEVDISTLELIDYFLDQEDVDLVASYIEGVSNGRKLIEVGNKALKAGKPIVIWKSGNTKAGRSAAASHTANLTASYELYKAAFATGGFIEVNDVDDFVDIAQSFHKKRLPRGRNVAIVTTSGGAGVVLADHCENNGLQLPPVSESAALTLQKILPPFAAIGNPLDMTAQGQNDIGLSPHNQVVKVMLDDPKIDQIIVRNGNVHGKAGSAWAEELAEIANSTSKPIMVSWGIVIDGTDGVAEQLKKNGVPCISTPYRLAAAMGAITKFSERARSCQTDTSTSSPRPPAVKDLLLPANQRVIGEHHSKTLLARYGIAATREILVPVDGIEALESCPLDFPVAVKIESPDVPHKTELGAVKLKITSLDELKSASMEIIGNVCAKIPSARIEGVLVQEMVDGLEAIVGVVNDEHFGPVVMFGLGGISTELLKDVSYRFAPFGRQSALEMIEEIRSSPLFHGYRNTPPLDIDALAETLSRVSYLAADHSEKISEIDINPLFVRVKGKGVVAADALIVLKKDK